MSIDFGKRLKELRNKIGLYQKDIASELGVTPEAISNWERGKTEPTYEQLILIADIFNVSLDYLLGRTDKNQIELEQKLEEARQLAKDLQKYLPDALHETELKWLQKHKK